MNYSIIYNQGILELSLLVWDRNIIIMLYRALMLYFNYQQDKNLYKNQGNAIGRKLFPKYHQIIITLTFLYLCKDQDQILKDFINLLLQHILIYLYPQVFTICESYVLSQVMIDYFSLTHSIMFAYLSEIVLILSVITVIIVITLSYIPVKELAFAITLVAILKINFFAILYYLQYKGDSLSRLLSSIGSRQFGYYFLIEFLLLLLVIPINYVKCTNIIRRKLFHFQIFLIVYAGYTINQNYTRLALSVFIWFFLVFEILRQYYRDCIWLLQWYNSFMLKFCDKRDSEQLIKTHIYLLMGISHSVLFKNNPYIGIICLGIGDSMAAIIGSKFGKIKYSNNRTLEGSLAFLATTILVTYLLGGNPLLMILGAFIEGYTGQIDNLILPLILMKFQQF